MRIRHTLIMAAGRGLRMGPLTDVIPKPMAPYLDSTLIGKGIQKLRPAIERVHVTVGYKGAMLAQHLIERGVDSVFNTEGHGNAWWLANTLMAVIDEPVFVLTCDNVTDIDFASLEEDYFAAGAPPCLMVPVRPVEGVLGDFITHDEEDQVVTKLSRDEATALYASGIQIVNPVRVNELCGGGVGGGDAIETFYDVWRPLMEKRLVPSGIRPLPWVARMAWHRLVLPDRQYLHLRHSGVYSGITWSPTLTLVTPAPISSTIPPPSCPSMEGKIPSGSAPD